MKKTLFDDWKNYYELINKTYNLRELAEKPILLDLIVQTLPQIQLKKQEKLNVSSLYETYTNFWLKRDDWRSYLNFSERSYITGEIAFYLFRNNKTKISYKDIPKIIEKKFPKKEKFESYYLDQDVRTCTFLNRDDKGDYSFVHKSFMEFFVAKKLCREINNNNFENCKPQLLTFEIARFMRDIKVNKNKIRKMIESTKRRPIENVKYLGTNGVILLKILKDVFEGKTFSEITLMNTDFSDMNLTNCDFQRSVLKNTIFSNTLLKNADFSFVEFDNVTFKNLNKSNLKNLNLNQVRGINKELFNKLIDKGAKGELYIREEDYPEKILDFFQNEIQQSKIPWISWKTIMNNADSIIGKKKG